MNCQWKVARTLGDDSQRTCELAERGIGELLGIVDENRDAVIFRANPNSVFCRRTGLELAQGFPSFEDG